MRIEFYRTGAERKALVTAIGEILEARPKYKGMPSAAYEIDYYTVTKDGTVEFDDRTDSEEVENLLEQLADRGIVAAPAEMAQAWLNARAEELSKASKTSHRRQTWGLRWKSRSIRYRWVILPSCWKPRAKLIRKALGISELSIEILEDRVAFPWFEELPNSDAVKAYTHFISALCEMSRNAKRVTATEKPVENEKYAFRCFLLRLGFIGSEYKAERKILLKNLTGSSAFKDGGVDHEVSE